MPVVSFQPTRQPSKRLSAVAPPNHSQLCAIGENANGGGEDFTRGALCGGAGARMQLVVLTSKTLVKDHI